MKEIAIIGGGAAGLACAIAASVSARLQGHAASVRVFERDERVGRSILATGNGRCNFSNAALDVGAYRNTAFVEEAFAALAQVSGLENAVLALFSDCGLVWREESEGRLYPLANKASAVLDVLRAAAAREGVQEVREHQVDFIDPPHDDHGRFTLRMHDGVFERADAVVLACGGAAVERVRIVDWERPQVRPTLGPLKTNTEQVRELNNIRARATVSLLRSDDAGTWHTVAVERGEVMFRKYGVSGIAVFNLSRHALPGDRLSIDFLSEVSAGDGTRFCADRYARLAQAAGGASAPALSCDDYLRGLVLPQVAQVLLKYCGLVGSQPCTQGSLDALSQALQAFPLTVQGIGDVDNCQVHRGGYAVEGFDPHTMESYEIPGLHVVGEALDVDGPCGGYNLHWAWASGMLAGIACATGGLRIEAGDLDGVGAGVTSMMQSEAQAR